MAEILLSLTIIGVVAAITLPSLTGNINERTWNTQRKALYARMSQAVSLMPSLNGYGNPDDYENTAAETFLTNGLSKVLKMNNICDTEHIADCGIPDKITTIDGKNLSNFTKSYNTLLTFNDMFSFSYSQVDSAGSVTYKDSYSFREYKAAAFETQNGESVMVYYNPNCTGYLNETSWYRTQPKMCANFVYDLNGNKGPNSVGKDIGFITALYPVDSVVVAPVALNTVNKATTYPQASNYCRNKNEDSRLPNKEELSSIFYNKLLTGLSGNNWSSSVASVGKMWTLRFHGGSLYPASVVSNSETGHLNGLGLVCIKR